MAFKDAETRRAYDREYYRRFSVDQLSRKKQNSTISKRKARKAVNDYLTNKSCIDCGISDTVVLDFDHVRGLKLFNISDAVRSGYGLKAILNEINKCDVRCANCHRRVTAKRRNNPS